MNVNLENYYPENRDLYLYNEGTHYRIYDFLGAHHTTLNGVEGTRFAVWAPDAQYVSLIGNFNDWNPHSLPLFLNADSGVWSGFAPGVGHGAIYKYHIVSRHNSYSIDKADPIAFYAERPPHTASIVWNLNYEWNDDSWFAKRKNRPYKRQPLSIYEFHAGSFMRNVEENNRYLTYRELASPLIEHIKRTGFTHVEFMPVMTHPYYPSWGYQLTGYFAPTARYGTPQDLMYLVDMLHQNDIGVIFDWVPSHFPVDGHGLSYFDGTHLYEHADPRKGFHPDWSSFIFNYGRHEVQSFLISSAIFWMEKYHADGIRVDGVASMLYLNYSREDGEWIPNEDGSTENREAVHFLRKLNHAVQMLEPECFVIAEESTAWPRVSHPVEEGGLGFDMKWDMGWMHDTLKYMELDPIYRKSHHGQMTFRMEYAFFENYVLSLSHDEVVHGKGSLLRKMPGDSMQKFANLRVLFSYMYALPGKKLLFMGNEFAQWNEWNFRQSLDWHLIPEKGHSGVLKVVSDLNAIYRTERCFYETDFIHHGFRWVDTLDWTKSIYCFLRMSEDKSESILCVFNFTPVVYEKYRVGVPEEESYEEIFNSDRDVYEGSNVVNEGELKSEPVYMHGFDASLELNIPPLAGIFLKRVNKK